MVDGYNTKWDSFPALLLFLPCILLLAGQEQDPTLGVHLTGFAHLPADSFAPGPVSGQFIEAANGRSVPFTQGQPVQGFSALLDLGEGSFLALADNGFGARKNSADFLLRVYRIRPEFKTAQGGAGAIRVESFFTLHDPDRHVPFSIIADQEIYPFGEQNIPVDPRIRSGRLLTGSDFDPESFQRLQDGTFWFGDEFGPWLLHTDADGRVLEPPVSLPGVMGPDHPLLGDGGKLAIFAFDPGSGNFSQDAPHTAWLYYPLDEGSTAIGDLTAYGKTSFLVIERDSREGPEARIKRIYRVDSTKRDDLGVLRKKLVVDLLNIADPDHLGGAGSAIFSFPFRTIESLLVIDKETIIVLNDNNYPFGQGRYVGESEPDDSEMILLHVPGL